jgi:hypothetical protein
MSKLGLVILLILTAGRNYAQEYFVLIQADSSQSFYVRLGDQLYSSSQEGHLILSRLKDSSYSITIGFPGQVFPEERFFFDIHQKDQVFRLRQENGQIWRLYDGQGSALKGLDAGEGGINRSRITGIKKDDAFSRLMADVVKDTAVMYNTYAMQQILSDSPSIVATAGSTAIGSATTGSSSAGSVTTGSPAAGSATTGSPAAGSATTVSSDTTALAHPAVDTSLFRPYSVKDTSVVTGHSMAAVPAGRDSLVAPAVPADIQAVAAMTGPVRRDSSAAAVPLYRPVVADSTAAAAPLYRLSDVVKVSEHKSARSLRLVYTDHAADSKTDTIVVIIPVDTGRQAAGGGHGPNPDSPVLGSGSGSRPADSLQKRAPAKSPLPFVNSDCHSYATDYDVDKLRIKMLGSGQDEDRIREARRIFKTKCFSTRQIKALSEVFATDATKFRFLEAAYPFVSDDHFPELISLFADPVYSGRFRTMTGRQ